VIIEENESDRSDPEDEAKNIPSDVDARRVERDASPNSAFATPKLTPGLAKLVGASNLWYDVEECCYINELSARLGSSEKEGLTSTPSQEQSDSPPIL
jgi:hypothetical protein